LQLRADNAPTRLTQKGIAIGCVGEERQRWWVNRKRQLDVATAYVESRADGLGTVADRARRERWTTSSFRNSTGSMAMLDESVVDEVAEDVAYAPYVARQKAELKAVGRAESAVIPDGINYGQLAGLSIEMKERLDAARPETIGDAKRVRGITPAALATILVAARRAAN